MRKIISIFSTKGGVGKSFLAVNLAASLAKDFSRKVLLVDLDFQAVGDMANMLNLSPKKTLADYFAKFKGEASDALHIREYVEPHICGLDFLPGILRPRQATHIEENQISNILVKLEEVYDFIIIDTGKAFSQSSFAALNNSNLIMMVLTPDVISVYQTKWALDMLQSLSFPLKMIKAILNRAESLGGVSWQEVKTALPVDLVANIPSEGKIVGLSINNRNPVVLDSPNSRISKSFRDLADNLIRNDKLFIEHGALKEMLIKFKHDAATQPKNFWLEQNLVEPLFQEKEEVDEVIELKKKIHHRLITELNLSHLDLTVLDSTKIQELREKCERTISNILAEETNSLLASLEVRKRLIKEIADEALGLGPLEDLISDPTISDILVNGKDQVYIERDGKLELTSKRFISNEQVKQIIERIISPLGRRIDESVPMVDARLPDGSRVNAIIPPLSLVGPTLSIRKFGRERLTIEDLLRIGTLDEKIRDFIAASVKVRKNIIVSGGTGSGKTTVLNILSGFIPDNERILTIEDAAELKLRQKHWVRLESRAPNIEGRGAVTGRDLFRNTLRMRPDRIIIGECRGAESLDMLQAMNTGHDGSLTTIHANSTRDVITRLDSMILMSGVELPIRAIREMIASAVNIVIHTARLSDGTRKITEIAELVGMSDDLHIEMKDIFIFKQTGFDGSGKIVGNFLGTGYEPSYLAEIEMRGIPLNKDMFKQ